MSTSSEWWFAVGEFSLPFVLVLLCWLGRWLAGEPISGKSKPLSILPPREGKESAFIRRDGQ